MWTLGWRDRVWADLSRPWDVIVIGGGITGAGILREAARVGLRVLLLEANDFASGTSSRSSKLVHGGLRYLKQGEIKLTFESVRERERLLREGRGLIGQLGFLLPNFVGDSPPAWVFGLGLSFYDVLAWHWTHRHYDALDMRDLCPPLRAEGLLGGYRYFDAQTDDARLVLRVVREAVGKGGVALNYARVENLLRRSSGQVCGVVARDMSGEAERTLEIQGTVVINASGAWADEVRGQLNAPRQLRQLRGSHLVFSHAQLPLRRAISFLHPVDRRPVFALPWEGVTLFGTTDVDHTATLNTEPAISGRESDYLLDAVRYAFPGLTLAEADVQAAFSGVRAVVNTGQADPSKESREHILWREHGLLTVTGGKLTTFRRMAHAALQTVRAELPGDPQFDRKRRLLITPTEVETHPQLDAMARWRLIGRYGADEPELLRAAQTGELEAIEGSVARWAELRWAARAEGVVHLDDLLLRRVRLGLLLPHGGLGQIDRLRAIVQPELGWDDARWAREIAAYRARWGKHYALGEAA